MSKKKQRPERLTTELRVVRRDNDQWDVEDAAHGDQAHTLVIAVVGPKRIAAPGLLTREAFGAWMIAMRDEGFDVTISDIHGNPAHLDD